ncbi:MAG TPA: hypothetical protein VFN25_16615 [Dokdonella sp.]|uniref:hypothetical protein n=1 Tax=Dokdonella sp. TaxID=2291710 RepID=UPI002D808361|nr:hypothetical protein [Dokdonella sp.]HET9034512.1 hypothetical protein [Dokdonella sp.]
MRSTPADSITTSRSAILPAAIVALAFLGSIAAIRFVTLDDRWYAAWVWHDSWIATAHQIAVAHGRFPKASTYTYFFPYLFDSQYFQAGVRLGTILLSALLAGNLLRRILRIEGAGVLFVLLFFAFAQNSSGHNLYVAYPFAWEFSWICWMAGLLGLMVAIKRQSISFALVGAAIWLVGLQEGFVPQTFVFLIVALVADKAGQKRWRYLAPYAAGLITWLIIWLIWRLAYPSNYDGSQLRLDASIGSISHTIVTYSIGGMPLATLLQGDWHLSWNAMKESVDVLSIIKAVAASIGVMRILDLLKRRGEPESYSRVVFISIVLLVMALVPNVLIGLTPKYQEWVRLGSHAYLYSHFSYFAWMALTSIFLLVIYHRWPSKALMIFFALAAGGGSLITDASNFDVSRVQEQFGRRWETMEALLNSEAFSKVPSTAAIWMRDSSISGSESGDAEYWQYVVEARTGATLVFTPDLDAARRAPGGAYYLYIYDEPKAENQYVVFAPLKAPVSSDLAIASNVYIFPNSANSLIRAGGVLSCVRTACVGSANANGRPSPALFASSFSVSAGIKPDAFGVDVVEVAVSPGTEVETLWVNFARNPVILNTPISVVPGIGFYGWEDNGTIAWNWGSLDSELEIRNELSYPMSLVLEFTIVVGDSRSIVVTSESGLESVTLKLDPEHPGFVSLPVEANAGVTIVKVHSTGPVLHDEGARKLAFQLRDLGLHRKNE